LGVVDPLADVAAPAWNCEKLRYNADARRPPLAAGNTNGPQVKHPRPAA
jgi:hypothetical protein